MSEEILKALTQLFAIITKQDTGTTKNERQFVNNFFLTELDQASIKSYLELYDQFSGYGREAESVTVTSVQDSVRTLNICKKINRTLTQKQKVVVLIKLLELVGIDKSFTAQRMDIINTVATVFNIQREEYTLLEDFVSSNDAGSSRSEDILVIGSADSRLRKQVSKFVVAEIDRLLLFVRVKSVGMYFVKYIGDESQILNGFVMEPGKIYLFSHGSTIKLQSGNAFYYSDLVADFNEEIKTTHLSFNARIESFVFPNGATGLHTVQISEGPGKLIGIMGASGAGKTTLLNVLAGLTEPTRGNVRINGFDIYNDKKEIFGVIGYVSQDDLLIEELTVYQNLYYNAKLCFDQLTEEQLDARVMEVLEQLGLDQRKELRVGTVLDKTISGGQRKRLNIALELIREPAVLFLDEPTSGLSSRDSENVIDLLKELSLKGKLIFSVIHQPSSDIYKMFDKMIIMDTGGFMAYYGPPVEAITYFKRSARQADSNRGQCETCGNVNPEQIFNIIEAKVVDEYGQATSKRKVSPSEWNGWYDDRFNIHRVEEVRELPPKSLHLPTRLKQMLIFTVRNARAKISNRQYLLINLLEAPLLALILAGIIRYRNAPDGGSYLFRFNDNFPAYLLMAVIVGIFMGLSISAEEIIRDRKILKRESFLHLSWNSYLLSKVVVLFVMSAVQTLSFVLIGNVILKVEWSMLLPFWLVLFSASCSASVLGLNISSAFNSAVTVYILIPLLLIPQMILSGLLFNFDKLNNLISTRGKVPLVADFMISRWAYEGLAVYGFRHNSYEEPYYRLEQEQAEADFKAAYVADALNKKTQYLQRHYQDPADTTRQRCQAAARLIIDQLAREPFRAGFEQVNWKDFLAISSFDENRAHQLLDYLQRYKTYYTGIYNKAVDTQDKMIAFFEHDPDYHYNLNEYKNRYFNQELADLVKNVKVEDRILEYKGRLVQQINPVYLEPRPQGILDYRAQFFAPVKNLLGFRVDTFFFNILVIWLMTLIYYLILYFELLRKLIHAFERMFRHS